MERFYQEPTIHSGNFLFLQNSSCGKHYKLNFKMLPQASSGGVRKESYFIRLSIDMAQMFLHCLSKLLVVCWMESHAVSLAHASESCSRTSQMLNADSTPAVCCSMSRCRSCHWQKKSLSRRKTRVATLQTYPFKMLQRMGKEQFVCQEKLS